MRLLGEGAMALRDWRKGQGGPSAHRGDLWSGGGKAYRAWMVSKSTGPEWSPNPRGAVRWTRTLKRGRRRWLLPLLSVIGLAVAILFAAPLAWSGRLNPCEAAEIALMDRTLQRTGGFANATRSVAGWKGQDGKLLSLGRAGQHIASREYAGWPPFAGCTALFWRARAAVAAVDGIWVALVRPPAWR